jgi:hypothetical protein
VKHWGVGQGGCKARKGPIIGAFIFTNSHKTYIIINEKIMQVKPMQC